MKAIHLSAPMQRFMSEATDLGLETAGQSREPFLPMLMVQTADDRTSSLMLYCDKDQPPEEVIPAACSALGGKPDLARYAVVSSVTVTINGEEIEGVSLEAAERAMKEAVVILVLFQRTSRGRRITATSDPELVRFTINYLLGPPPALTTGTRPGTSRARQPNPSLQRTRSARR